MYNKAASLIVYAGLMAAQANAFWNKSHMLVAREAQSLLETDHPDVFAAALNELVALQQSRPDLVQERDHPFTECAPFADHVKGMGFIFQSDWHFINLPYLDEPGTTLDDFNFTQPDKDIVGALTDFTKFLKGEITAADSFYCTEVANVLPEDADQRSFILRMIVHYVGDIHQPEHTTALVDSKYPEGDRGGNSESIPSVEGADNLHFVWDSAIYEYPGKGKPPLSDDLWTWFTSEAERLEQDHPISED